MSNILNFDNWKNRIIENADSNNLPVITNISDFLNEQTTVRDTNAAPYGKRLAIINWDDLPAKLPANTPSAGYISINGGNTYLARKRAESLQTFLITYFKSKVGYDLTKENMAAPTFTVGKGKAAQYVKATVSAILKKKEEETKKSKWTILYDWYKVGDSDTPWVLISSAPNTKKNPLNTQFNNKQNSPSVSKTFLSATNKTEDILMAGYYKSQGNVGKPSYSHYSFGNPLEGWTSRDNSRFYYPNEESWKAAVIRLHDMSPFQSFTMKMGSGPNSGNFIDPRTSSNPINAKGRYIPGTSGLAKFSASKGGKEISGKKLSLTKKDGEIIVANIEEIKKAIPVKAHLAARLGDDQVTDGDTPDGSTSNQGEQKWHPIAEKTLQAEYPNNMVKVSEAKQLPILEDIKNQIKAKLGDKWEIVNIRINVEGGASDIRASNRLPNGVTAPDHTYGNKIPANRWVPWNA